MSSRSIEITAKYHGERMHFDNADGSRVVIGVVSLADESKQIAINNGLFANSQLTIKGQVENDELQPNLTYRFFGTFQSYVNRRLGAQEKQFHFRTFVLHVPRDRQGVIDYLANAGKGNGIGPSKARQLVDRFGVEQVLEDCRRLPDMIAEVTGIRIDQAHRLADKLAEQAATEHATLEVDQLLHGKGFPRTLVNKLIKTWGNKAAELINADPYSLMQFRGVGFKLTDKLYIALGKNPSSIDRQALCLWYAMASDNEGHTWFPAAEPVRKLRQMIGGDIDYRAAIARGKEYGQISENHYGAIATLRTCKDRAIRDDLEDAILCLLTLAIILWVRSWGWSR